MSRQAAATPADVRAAIGVEELENVEANLRRSNEDPLCDELFVGWWLLGIIHLSRLGTHLINTVIIITPQD